MNVLVWAVALVWIIPLAVLLAVLCGCVVSRRFRRFFMAHVFDTAER